jgi:hypothetical protein
LQTGNFPLRTLIRIITTLITEGRWGIWEIWSLKESGICLLIPKPWQSLWCTIRKE